jgi:beta-lactamase superfamily II metal-dependent hydrolase
MSAALHVLDVGNGNCAIAQGDNWTAMIDAAPGATVLEALEHLEINRLDAIAISHRDADHAGGVVPLLTAPGLEIGIVYISADALKDPSAPRTAMLLAALEDAKKSGRCKVLRDLDTALPSGDLSGGGLELEVLAPTFATAMTGPGGKSQTGGRLTSNTVSAVLRVTSPDGLRVLLPGDIDDVALKELRARGTDLSADVLVFPHHGSHSAVADEEAFAREVVELVAPRIVLFSVGRAIRPRPTEKVLRGVLGADPEIYIACTQLSRGCLATDDELLGQGEALHLSDLPAAGREACHSCAGSMTLEGARLSDPSQTAHQQYVASVATAPMCVRFRPSAADTSEPSGEPADHGESSAQGPG